MGTVPPVTGITREEAEPRTRAETPAATRRTRDYAGLG